MRIRNRAKLGLLFAALLVLGTMPGARAGMITYGVSFDTSSFSGTEGYLDIQLGTAGDHVPVQATVNNFATDGSLSGMTDNLSTGTATISGSLPGVLTLINDDSAGQTAYGSQHFSAFGSLISFSVTVTTDSTGSSPTLAISLFGPGPDFLPLYAGPVESNYAAAVIQIQPDGSAVTTTYGGVDTNDAPPPTLTPQAVPEPTSLVMLGLGVLGLVGVQNLRRRRTA